MEDEPHSGRTVNLQSKQSVNKVMAHIKSDRRLMPRKISDSFMTF